VIARIRRVLRRVLGRAEPVAAPSPGQLPPSFVRFKDYVDIHPTAIVASNAALQIFDPPDPPRICLTIGEGCHVFSTFSLLRRDARIAVGRNCQLGASQFIAASEIEVADDVIMAWGCTVIDTDNHSLEWEHRSLDVERCRRSWAQTNGQDIGRLHDWTKVRIGKVTLGPKSWVGFNTIILKGVTVGEGAIVGAGSVVRRSVPAWARAAGNPCDVIRAGVENA
jgi:acetyltransferase-like isoleucine patch superfamily enzyme